MRLIRTTVRAYWMRISRLIRQLRIMQSITELASYAYHEAKPVGQDDDPGPTLPPPDMALKAVTTATYGLRQPMMWSATQTYASRKRKGKRK